MKKTRIYALPIRADGSASAWTWGRDRDAAEQAAHRACPDCVCVVLAGEPRAVDVVVENGRVVKVCVHRADEP